MSMSIAASLNSNPALSVCNIQINFLAVSLLMLSLESVGLESVGGLRRYMPDEPGGFDNNKKPVVPVHHRKGTIQPHTEKQNRSVENNTVVTGIVGTNVLLKCNVLQNDVTVLWVKHDGNTTSDNVDVLTVNSSTLVDDKRYLVTQENNTQIWTLHIRYVKSSDQGLYECQVCTSPTSSIYVSLKLFEVHAVILGPNIKEVDQGFPIRLSCILNTTNQYRIKRPTYMFWYHGNRMINYDLKDGAMVSEGRLGTELIFQRALSQHAGNYSCVPSNAKQASVQVIVHFPGEELKPHPSAFEGSEGAASKNIPVLMLLMIIFAPCVYQ